MCLQNGSLRFSGNCQNLSKLNIKLSEKVLYSRKKDLKNGCMIKAKNTDMSKVSDKTSAK